MGKDILVHPQLNKMIKASMRRQFLQSLLSAAPIDFLQSILCLLFHVNPSLTWMLTVSICATQYGGHQQQMDLRHDKHQLQSVAEI